jgi:hypothetical protein
MSDGPECPEVDDAADSPRRPGRKVRAMSAPFSRGSAAHAPKCRECPKHDGAHNVCPLLGAHQCGSSPACRYGIVLIRAKRMADRRANTQKKEE